MAGSYCRVVRGLCTCAAATDIDRSVCCSLGRFRRSQHLGDSSAAQIAALTAVGLIAMEIMIWLIAMSEEVLSANGGLSLLLSSCGAVTAAIGGFVAWRGWEGKAHLFDRASEELAPA